MLIPITILGILAILLGVNMFFVRKVNRTLGMLKQELEVLRKQHLAAIEVRLGETERRVKMLADRVDFITTPGYIEGPGAREKWGLPPDTGPQVIITNKAVLRFDEETKEAYLASYHPDCTVEEIVGLTPWDLKVADDVHETEPPTDEEIRAMREIIDPNRMISIYEKRGYV